MGMLFKSTIVVTNSLKAALRGRYLPLEDIPMREKDWHHWILMRKSVTSLYLPFPYCYGRSRIVPDTSGP